VPTVLKSGSPNLLEPSGPVQACNGIALPFYILLNSIIGSVEPSAFVVNFIDESNCHLF